MNKWEDLCMLMGGAEPDVIIITEVIPKAQLLPLSPAFLSVDGCNLFSNFDPTQEDLGRSGYQCVCIYVKDLSCREVVFSTGSTFEYFWINVCIYLKDLLCREVVFSTGSAFDKLWINISLKHNDMLLIGYALSPLETDI